MRRKEAAIHPVILAGGNGTRLWPISRSAEPKQFLALLGEGATLFQQAVGRAADMPEYAAPTIVCNEQHHQAVVDQLRQLGVRPHRIIVEPMPRNTAAALVAAALALCDDEQAAMLAQPSDHVIADSEAFHYAVRAGVRACASGLLVTFGLRPSRAETGYGYIRCGELVNGIAGIFKVEEFVEKPDRQRAAALSKSGRYLWNSGIFLFPCTEFLNEMRRCRPKLVEACQEAMNKGAGEDDISVFLDRDSFSRIEAVSVDVALMQNTTKAAVVPVEMGWNDVGSWEAMYEVQPTDGHGNAVEGDVILEDVKGSLVRSEGPLVAAVGVEDLVVVATGDAVLVVPRRRAAEVGRLVSDLQARGRQEATARRQVQRPWGYFQTVACGDRFQVKRIVVKPGGRLSLQKHHHRAEHWVVVHGTAAVTVDGCTKLLLENQAGYIPVGAQHRLENLGKIALHLIEVQCGSYLGEDDIVRFEDSYGRV